MNDSILIVDDVPEHIAYSGKILKSAGYIVYAVTGGKDALKFLEKRHPDIIMLDIKMDDIDGFEVCRRIKNNDELKEIPVIFITSENDPEVIKNGFSIGCCDYLVKPFTKEEYLARVKTHIENAHQRQELIRANNELDMFCSSVSHDLKSPLNSLIMLTDTLKAEAIETGENGLIETAEMISRKSGKITEMIDCLLRFSRLCNIIPEVESIDLNMMIHDIFDELKSFEPERNIMLECSELPVIQGDEVLIEMLMKNIMSNAFKFTSNTDSAFIKVNSNSENGFHIITIKDNGVGFDMMYSDKIFHIFQRLHSSEVYDGNGVGLALCKRIIERHGGKIKAFGQTGIGAEFKIYFPV